MTRAFSPAGRSWRPRVRVAVGLAVLRFERAELARECRLLARRQGLVADRDHRKVEHRALERREGVGVERRRTVEADHFAGGVGEPVDREPHGSSFHFYALVMLFFVIPILSTFRSV